MSAVARGLFVVRRHAGGRWALVVLLGVWPLLAVGSLSGPTLLRAELPELSVLTVLAVALLWTVVREVSPRRAAGREAIRELELGLLLVTSVYVLVAATGGIRSFLYPLVYAVVSFLMVVHRYRPVAAALLLGTGLLEVAVGWRGAGTAEHALMAYHLVFIGFFAAGNLLVLGSLVRRLRGQHEHKLDAALATMRQEARDFRLIASSLPACSRTRSREEEELRMAYAGVESVREQLFHTLDLLRTSMGLRSCALLWCEGNRNSVGPLQLTVKELATDSEYALEQPTLPSPGILTSVVANPRPLRLERLAGKRLPPYYQGPEPITDLCAVPLLDGASLRAILCADRIGDRPFADDEAALLERAAQHIARVIEHERVFTAVERSKYEQEQFYRASELLNEALTLEQVYEKTFAALAAFAHHDLAVITEASSDARSHRVIAVHTRAGSGGDAWAQVAERLVGLEFSDPTSMVAMAVKNRHFMPAGGEMLDPDTVVFNARTRLRTAKSLLVLPLTRGDQVLGAVTLAAARPQQYPAQTREMLRVISHHVGVSLQNARMYQSMEERATTDGLTGLTNHRAFQERLAQLHALAERTDHKYAIILTDIDHFKSINDTYGHPIGDQVLKRVAALFAGRARKVDIVARYGGEEFVLVLPDTDGEGALHFANRLRQEVGELVMTSEHGTFKITVSMGVAEFPGDGRERLSLIERADQALYWCKEHGRNRVHRARSVTP
jgi:diguanylate cyclase (GGDEF)-like protein